MAPTYVHASYTLSQPILTLRLHYHMPTVHTYMHPTRHRLSKPLSGRADRLHIHNVQMLAIAPSHFSGRENSLASFGRQVRGLLNSSQYVAAATERRSPLRLPIRRVARTVTGCGLRPPSYKASMPFPTITAASAVAAQPPGPRQHQPPSHILIAPGTRDLVTPVSRGLAFSDFVANNASFLSWRDRSSHPWCVV